MSAAAATRAAEIAPRISQRTRLGLALGLGGLCVVLDTTIAVVAVPALMREFNAPLATMQWTTTAYLLALVTTLPLAARLSTRYGARRVYVSAILVFGLASALAGLASGPATLIAARVLQGLGGGLLNPVGMILVMRGVPAHERGRVTSLLGLPVLVGPLCGPILSGWLIDSWSWRAIFFITVPPALVAAALVRHWAPRDEPGDREPLDVVGLGLLLPGATVSVFGLGEASFSPVARIALMVLGVALLTAFVLRSRRVAAPLLRVRLLWRPSIAINVSVLVLFGAAYFGSMLLMPTYVQVIRGDSALMAGTMAIPAALATGVSLQICTRLVDRVAPWRVVTVGLSMALAGSIGTVLVLRADTSYAVLMALAALTGAGSGGVIMPGMTAAMRELNGPDLASGSSVMGLAQQLASAVGTAGITALLAAAIAWQVPGLDGGLEAVSRMAPGARAALAPDLVAGQRIAQLAAVVLIAVALVVATTLMRTSSDRKQGEQ
ncbi:DHA2 family efflux MFS transporter permease subunit [Luteipulveratus mongoliensis]|uniref:Major facilitator superfamily (MFS) profile domain-containing protein n=1 Tax=Luteipulveratus mongoliensis TaxID=571913 RepID=A0A0K1JEP5_9MICO|nr:DHA2 family efflux MFS transporter permease subunit [Luteipulveratus mongoliensis]AKU15174.1 hypothetical protein VV02_03705 [Luteipulveratus mongoliensis]